MATFERGDTLDVTLELTDDATGLPLVPETATVTLRIGARNAKASYQATMAASEDRKTFTHTVPAETTINLNGNYWILAKVVETDTRTWTPWKTAITFDGTVMAQA